MTITMRRRFIAFMNELPGAFMLALLTAATTIVLAIVISMVTGTENAEHRIAARCFANQTTNLIREIIQTSDTLSEKIDLDDYPPIDVTGIDCDAVFEHLDTSTVGD